MRRTWGVLADYLSALRGTIWIRLHRAHPRSEVIWVAAAAATVASFTLFWFGVGGKGTDADPLDRPTPEEVAGAAVDAGATTGPGGTSPPGGSGGSTVTTSGTGSGPGATSPTTSGGDPVTGGDPTWESQAPGGPASPSTVGTAPPSSGSTTSTTGSTTTPAPPTTAPPSDDGVVGGLFDLLGGLFGG